MHHTSPTFTQHNVNTNTSTTFSIKQNTPLDSAEISANRKIDAMLLLKFRPKIIEAGKKRIVKENMNKTAMEERKELRKRKTLSDQR